MVEKQEDTTARLAQWSDGCQESGNEILQRLYPDLHRLARGQRWGTALSDSTSDLAQELCLRLFQQRSTRWKNRGHFFAIAAKLMRRIAVDHSRRASSLKRGGSVQRVGLDMSDVSVGAVDIDVLALDQALRDLARSSPAAAQVVELRFFAGLNVDETSAVLEIGRATVIRRWRFARAWLNMALAPIVVDGEAG